MRPSVINEYSVEGKSIVPYLSRPVLVNVQNPRDLYIRGDANRDFDVNISDVILILRYLFVFEKTLCHSPMDSNNDGRINIIDASRLVEFLFRGGIMPQRPFPLLGILPGRDGTLEDDLGNDC